MDEKDFYWEHLKHEDTLFSNRTSFLLLAESVLLVVAVSLLTPLQPVAGPGHAPVRVHLGPLCLAGLLISLIWLFADLKHLLTTNWDLKAKLQSSHPEWAAIAKGRRRWPSTHWVVGIGLPVLFLALWGYVWSVHAGRLDLAPILKGTARVLVIIGLVFNIAGVVLAGVFGLPTVRVKPLPASDGGESPLPPPLKRSRWSPFLGVGLLVIGFVVQLIGVIVGW
jgi:hypothetical protein